MDDFRLLSNLRFAEKIDFTMASRPSNPAARLGLQYERRVKRELFYHVEKGNLISLDHNPWFSFKDDFGSATCAPDFVLTTETCLTVVEVKLTWVEVAEPKLRELYCPVVSLAYHAPVRGFVICKNLTPKAPPAAFTLSQALAAPLGLLHWPNNGHIPWK